MYISDEGIAYKDMPEMVKVPTGARLRKVHVLDVMRYRSDEEGQPTRLRKVGEYRTEEYTDGLVLYLLSKYNAAEVRDTVVYEMTYEVDE